MASPEGEEDWASEAIEVTADKWEKMFGVKPYGKDAFKHLTHTHPYTPICILGQRPEQRPVRPGTTELCLHRAPLYIKTHQLSRTTARN